jgi:chromosomal replication initiator protein
LKGSGSHALLRAPPDGFGGDPAKTLEILRRTKKLSQAPQQLWDGVLRRLGAEISSHALDAWVRPLEPRIEGERLRLVCPSAFHRERVRVRLLPLIARHLAAERGQPVDLELVVSPSGDAAAGRAASPAGSGAAPADRRPATEAPLRPRGGEAARGGALPQPTPVQLELPYRFENFVVGRCNALAREAGLAVARGQQRRINPLYVFAQPGLGKTHLARAIAVEARDHGDGRVLFSSAEAFTNEFLAAIRSRDTVRFKRRYREGVRLLVVDDVQFLRAKRATQLELIHTVAHLMDVGARVVLTGDRLPRDFQDFDPRLRSQLGAGLVAELEPPDASVRREIVRRKASAGGVRLPDDCLELLVESVRGSVRDLESALIQLVASASLLKRPLDLELARLALQKLLPAPAFPQRLSARDVIELVAAFFALRADALAARTRRRDVLWPRQLAMVLCVRHTDAGAAEIGRIFGREHTAVRNALQSVERRILERPRERYQVEALTSRLDALREERAARG